jgi:hypothetical protein
MTEKETIEVRLSLPKEVYEFYLALAAFLKQDFQNFLLETLTTDLEGFLEDPGDLVKLYHLENYCKLRDC